MISRKKVFAPLSRDKYAVNSFPHIQHSPTRVVLPVMRSIVTLSNKAVLENGRGHDKYGCMCTKDLKNHRITLKNNQVRCQNFEFGERKEHQKIFEINLEQELH